MLETLNQTEQPDRIAQITVELQALSAEMEQSDLSDDKYVELKNRADDLLDELEKARNENRHAK